MVDSGSVADSGSVDSGSGVDSGSAADSGSVADAGSGVDSGPTSGDASASCTAGKLRRCWVECVQKYPAGCIHGDVPPRIPGVQHCTAGTWGACKTPIACTELAGSCVNAAKQPVTYTCLDGSAKNGQFHCIKPLGAKCATSFWAGYGATDCPHLCTTQADQCATKGAKRACEVHCDKPDGAVVKGTQTCSELCKTKVWGVCLTGDGCWKKAGSP